MQSLDLIRWGPNLEPSPPPFSPLAHTISLTGLPDYHFRPLYWLFSLTGMLFPWTTPWGSPWSLSSLRSNVTSPMSPTTFNTAAYLTSSTSNTFSWPTFIFHGLWLFNILFIYFLMSTALCFLTLEFKLPKAGYLCLVCWWCLPHNEHSTNICILNKCINPWATGTKILECNDLCKKYFLRQ